MGRCAVGRVGVNYQLNCWGRRRKRNPAKEGSRHSQSWMEQERHCGLASDLPEQGARVFADVWSF